MKFEMDFDWGGWLDYVSQPPLMTGRCEHASIDPNFDFCGTYNYAEAMDLARVGWPEGTQQMVKLSGALVDKVASMIERQSVYYTDDGGVHIDIARYLEDEPECWMNLASTLAEGPGKFIKLVFNGATSCGINKNTIIAKGAAIAALIELLEIAGNRVEATLIFHWTSSDRLHTANWRILVKDFDQPLDSDRLAFALAHPSSIRRLNFRAQELIPDNQVRKQFAGMSYGTPSDPGAVEADIYIARSHLEDMQDWTPASATKWILKTLEAQGIKTS